MLPRSLKSSLCLLRVTVIAAALWTTGGRIAVAGEPFRVDGGSSLQPWRPRVAVSGAAVAVAWEELESDTASHVKARIFDGSGAPQGAEFIASGAPRDGILDQFGVALAADRALGGPSFMLAWSGGSGLDAARTQRFDYPGQRVGPEVCVDFYGCGQVFQTDPDVAGSWDSVFYYTWVRKLDGAPFAAYPVPHVVAYDKITQHLGAPEPVTTDTTASYGNVRIATNGVGHGWVLWTAYTPADGERIQVRRITEGTLRGPVWILATPTGFGSVDLACQGTVECLAVWNSTGGPGGGKEIYAQRLAVSLTSEEADPRRGGVFQVNPDQADFYGATAEHQHPRVAGGRDWAVIWDLAGDVVFQRLSSDGSRVGGPKRAFESGVSRPGGFDVAALLVDDPFATGSPFVVTWEDLSRREIWGRTFEPGAASQLPAPSNLRAQANGPTSVQLDWSDNSATETGFAVEREISAGAWQVAVSVPANQTLGVVEGLPPGSTQSFRVRAVAGDQQSPPSASATVTLPAGGDCALSLLAPVGDPLARSTKSAVRWNASAGCGPLRLDLLTPSGASQAVAASLANGQGKQYIWTVPSGLALGTGYRLRLSAAGKSATSASFAVVATRNCVLALATPNGGEQISRGATVTVRWSAAGSTCGSQVDLELLRAGKTVLVISPQTASDGSEVWTVPASVALGSNYRIRVRTLADRGVFDLSNGNFRIR